ncbi:DUF1499 domain-containing protein [Falsiroseomonas sp. CW058]|uniref:DUF1499 domain-containing protein n=1 Tax=Falsiroseomonas sp. CW058 TaxID=3388664 RepID=UPI003D3206E6
MSTLAMMLGRGPAGLPPAAPLDFPALVLPPSPNACLAAPPGATTQPHEAVPLLPVSPETAWAALRRLGGGFERVWTLGEWPELHQLQWVARTRFANFPDLVNAQVVPLEGGAGLWLYSRSLIGWSDLGVNRRRVLEWVGALRAAL